MYGCIVDNTWRNNQDKTWKEKLNVNIFGFAEGDQNNKYFYATTEVKMRNNQITHMNKDPLIHTKNEGLRGKVVSSLFNFDKNYLDVNPLHDMYDPSDMQLIDSIPIHCQENDSWH